MKQIFTQIILACVVLTTLLFSASCDRNKAQKTLRDFKVKSAELSVYGEKMIKAFGDAFRAGEISQSQLLQLNRGTGAFVRAVGVYRTAIAQADAIVNSHQPLPTNTLDTLNTILNEEVIKAFFDILVSVGVMPLAQSEIVKTIISGIRLTILAIKGAFSDARDLLNQQGGRQWQLQTS